MSPLSTNPLGRSGMDITRVGFGAWAIGGGDWAFSWGPQDDAASIEAIHHAIELGINWIDTAAVYGLGHSEEVVGRAVKALPANDRPYVFTKCGLIWDDNDKLAPPRRVGAPESIKAEVESSLRRLGLERIDLYQMHWPAEDGSQLEEYWGALLELEREGKIRAAALSNHSVAELERAESLGHVQALQPPFSPIDRKAAGDVIPWCAGHQTGVIVYSPMHSGLLSGSFSKQRLAALDAGDWRRRSPDFTGEALERNLALSDALVPLAERHEVSVGAIAIAWTLSFLGVSGAIVGARSAEQVDGWIDAADLVLSEEELGEIARAIEQTGAGEGPVSPPR